MLHDRVSVKELCRRCVQFRWLYHLLDSIKLVLRIIRAFVNMRQRPYFICFYTHRLLYSFVLRSFWGNETSISKYFCDSVDENRIANVSKSDSFESFHLFLKIRLEMCNCPIKNHSIYLWFICFTWWSIDELENLHADRTTVCFEPW